MLQKVFRESKMKLTAIIKEKKMQRETKNKKRVKGKFRRNLTPLLVTLLLVIVFSAILSIYFTQEEKYNALCERNKELLIEMEETQYKKDELEKIIENWNTPEYKEKIAREEFGLVKPGEIIFID